MEFLLVALATFTLWSVARMFLPKVATQGRLAPFLVAGIAYGLTFVPVVNVLVALASASIVAVLVTFTSRAELPDPPSFHRPEIRLPKRLAARRAEPADEATGQGYRPSGQVGRRIPQL